MIYFLIPTYNEEQNIPLLITNLKSLSLSGDICFVFSDDGSTDNTKKLIEAGFAHGNYEIIGDGRNKGPGHAFSVGFEWILDNSISDSDVVITLEADNTSDLGILYQMLGNIELGFDVVLASVYAQGGGMDKTTLLRRVLSSCANLFFRFVFDIKVLTLSSFYRAYKVGVLRKIHSKYGTLITEYGFICMLEILVRSIKIGAKIVEIPMILYSKNRKGNSKMKIFSTTVSYVRFLFGTRI